MAGPAHAESPHQERLRTGEAETAEPATQQPLKAALQNLFLQEDVFPQEYLALQVGQRLAAFPEQGRAALQTNSITELGLGDSWTVSVAVPIDWLPADERRVSNPALGLLYSFWVSRNENGRLSAFTQNTFPSPAAGGDHAFAHDVGAIVYLRLAPLHLQAVAMMDVSYGRDVSGTQVRPEGAAAAILKLGDAAFDWEIAVQRDFDDLSYLSTLGIFFYPGSFELGAAARCDWSDLPLTFGGILLVSYQRNFDD